METQETALLRLELKYCERCGALWLRLWGSDVVICTRCAKAIAPVWPGSLHTEETNAPIPARNAFWTEGGNA